MNRYQSHQTSSRMALGATAVALTLLAIGLLLVAPATMTTDSRDSRPSAISPAGVVTDEARGTLRIEVTGVREPSIAAAQARSMAKRKQQS
jgi:hypothetical protein